LAAADRTRRVRRCGAPGRDGVERHGVGEGDVACILLRSPTSSKPCSARMLGAYSADQLNYKPTKWLDPARQRQGPVTDAALRRESAHSRRHRPPRRAFLASPGLERRAAPRSDMPYTPATGRAKGVRRIPPPAAEATAMEALSREGMARVRHRPRARSSRHRSTTARRTATLQAMLNGERWCWRRVRRRAHAGVDPG
jgi:hypothetical protein